jgi:hypothetical protein
MAINPDKLNQTANGKGFRPNQANKAKRTAATEQPIAPSTSPAQPAAPSIPDEQKGLTVAGVQDAALQRVQESRDASGEMVQALMSAAQNQAAMQAQAIAAYPQLVDQLTVGYLQQMGVSEAGKSTPCFDFSAIEVPAMETFTALLISTNPRQLAAAVEG